MKLNLYCARADQSPDWKRLLTGRGKEDAVFSGESSGRVMLIVPDQATLQTERTIIESLGLPGLIDMEVTSFSRLGRRILDECGGITRRYIDDRGRHMLLAKIISESRQELQIFGRAAHRQTFVRMMASQIAEFKQFNTQPEDLAGLADDSDSILSRKLHDIGLIFGRYEEAISGKYTDTEDQINLYTSKIREAESVRGTEFWVSGFDYYTPKTLMILEQLMLYAPAVHVLVSLDQGDDPLFAVGRRAALQLSQIAGAYGIKVQRYEQGSQRKLPADLHHLEKELFSYPAEIFQDKPCSISITECSNYHTEAETAAALIMQLVRDQQMRFKDIAVICNDPGTRSSILKRVFADYRIPCFMDQKRSIMHSKFAVFVLALLQIVSRNYRYEDVFQLLKTGLVENSPISDKRFEKLENYVLRYKIAGRKWRSEFTYGKKDKYGNLDEGLEAELAETNLARQEFMQFMEAFERVIKPCDTVRKKSEALYFFLRDYAKLPEKVQQTAMELRQDGLHEYALETAQVWNVIIATLEQAAELAGDVDIKQDIYIQMLAAGFEAEEVGVIPTTIDQVIVGTLQRTRIGQIKALLIVGANDGLLPGAVQGEDLLHEHEKTLLLNQRENICKSDGQRLEEEQLAIYRLFTLPERQLFLSYSASDIDGREIRPSVLAGRLREVFPKIRLQKDIVNRDETQALFADESGSFKYVVEGLRKALDGDPLDDTIKIAYNQYYRQSSFGDKLKRIRDGLFYSNEVDKLSSEQVKELYRRNHEATAENETFIFSPSQLEAFSGCPFSHLMRYGIKPSERKVFEVAAPELGEIFHEALLLFSQEVTTKGSWGEMAEGDNAFHKIGEIIEQIAPQYREGVLAQSRADEYRVERIKRVCGKTAKAVATQICRGIESFNQFYFETVFGQGGILPGLLVVGEGGTSSRIEGRIDRIDILEKDGKTYIKIVDYKSGNESMDIEEARLGWRLQMSLYLLAAIKGMTTRRKGDEIIPAGMFYFGIGDPTVLIDQKEKMEKEIQKQYRMDGILLNDTDVILGMDPEIGGRSGYSDVIPVQNTKGEKGFQGASKSRRQLLDREEFDQFINDMEKITSHLCDNLMKGSIDIQPKKLDNSKSACTYCQYKLICCYQ